MNEKKLPIPEHDSSSKKGKVLSALKGQAQLLVGLTLGIGIAIGGFAYANKVATKNNDKPSPVETSESVTESPLASPSVSSTGSQIPSPATTSPQANRNNTPKSTTQNQVPSSGTTNNGPNCNEALKQAYIDSYNAAVAQENSRYEKEMLRIASFYCGRGLCSSGDRENAERYENSTHQNNLAQLLATKNANIAKANCS